MTMLAIIYTILLGVLCTCFVEAGIYAFFPRPEVEIEREWYGPDATEEDKRLAKQVEARRKRLHERHSLIHYVFSLLGSTILALISLTWTSRLGVLADGILLGSVLTIGSGTCFGIMGGGRVSRFAVATASLLAALVLGYLKFLPR